MKDDLLVFHEHRTRLKPGMGPQSRVRFWLSHGAPEILNLVLWWSALHDKAWVDAGGTSGHFYTLPGERDPGAWPESSWFMDLLKSLPSPLVEHFDHHGLRGGGASACYALEVPERRIRAWGDWRSNAMWSYIDVYWILTEWDYRIFGWMTITARDLHAQYGHIFCPGGAVGPRG